MGAHIDVIIFSIISECALVLRFILLEIIFAASGLVYFIVSLFSGNGMEISSVDLLGVTTAGRVFIFFFSVGLLLLGDLRTLVLLVLRNSAMSSVSTVTLFAYLLGFQNSSLSAFFRSTSSFL